MVAYDEADINARLAKLDRFHRTAFAAACAERLWPLFERYARATGEGDVEALRSILDMAWSAAQGVEVEEMAGAQAAAAMVPAEGGEWVFEMGYGQNAAAAVAYALRARQTDDPQEAVWSARQLYEAADYAAQRALPDLDLNAPGVERALFQSPAVQSALAALSADLIDIESSEGHDWVLLRERAREEGEVWARTLP